MDTQNVTVLRTFPTTGEALIYKTLLESNGIDAELLNETSSDVLPLQNEMMEIKLIVREADAAKPKRFSTPNSMKKSSKQRAKNGVKNRRTTHLITLCLRQPSAH